jgi:hypothetical protein
VCQYTLQGHAPDDPLPPTRLRLLKVPPSPQLLTKHRSLWGHFRYRPGMCANLSCARKLWFSLPQLCLLFVWWFSWHCSFNVI